MNKPRTIAIIQARMASSRLPGKVLKDIQGRPMLAWVVDRASYASSLDGIGVATTIDSTDDPIAALCREMKYSVYRGSSHDVLDRIYQAALLHRAEVIVRLTADCPLIDPVVIDHTVNEFFRTGVDFAANRLPPPWKRTYPNGLDTEVCTLDALERAWREADKPHQREHVMPYLYEEEGRFRTFLVNHEPDYGHLRWTVDTPEDLELIQQVFARFEGRDDFSWEEILELFEREHELAKINAAVHHKTAHDIDERAT
ncbi:MAG: glycosyltransferase family protein [Anaerolineaceae bacterium]|nr:glycosyltransferase family protein [Anaerolineaceae bacterium]